MKQEAYAAQLKAEQERGRLLARRYNQVSALRLVCFLLVLFAFAWPGLAGRHGGMRLRLRWRRLFWA